MGRRFYFGAVAFWLVLILFPDTLWAEEEATTPSLTQEAVDPRLDQGERWYLTLSPYIWFAGIEGTVGQAGLDAEVDAGFGDLIDNVNLGVMVAAEVRYRRTLILSDFVWINASDEKAIPRRFFGPTNVDATATNTIWALAVGYRMIDDYGTTMDGYLGARYWHLGTELSFTPVTAQVSEVDTTENWVDPIVGLRIQTPLGGNWLVTALGEVGGGFDVGADLEWQVLASLGYSFTPHFTLAGGYRYLSVDFEDAGFTYDVEMQGAFLGGTFRF